MDRTIVSFRYVNHRGEEAVRTVRPIRLWWGSTAWHTDSQWHLEAWDLDRQETRDFALANLRGPWTENSGN